eukprot:7480654-Prorocentrum_lima.AAC.1
MADRPAQTSQQASPTTGEIRRVRRTGKHREESLPTREGQEGRMEVQSLQLLELHVTQHVQEHRLPGTPRPEPSA